MKQEKLIPLLDKLRRSAKKQKGFINRHTYASRTNPGEYIVISKWKSVEDWKKWMKKKKTRDRQDKVDSLLGEGTIFDIYEPETF